MPHSVPVRPDPPAPASPTHHPPGSLAKIDVMRRRVARGEGLWHPLDARVAGDLPAGAKLNRQPGKAPTGAVKPKKRRALTEEQKEAQRARKRDERVRRKQMKEAQEGKGYKGYTPRRPKVS